MSYLYIIGYNFLKKDLNKIKKFTNPTLDIDNKCWSHIAPFSRLYLEN